MLVITAIYDLYNLLNFTLIISRHSSVTVSIPSLLLSQSYLLLLFCGFFVVLSKNMTAATTNDNKSTDTHLLLPKEIGTDYTFKRKIVWFNALGFVALHLAAIFGLFLCFRASLLTIGWMLLVGIVSGEGITIGAHRLYSHKAFKATLPVRFVLILLQTIAGQNCMYIWVRDHRQHHKYSDTDADPHNANRGFFFSHVGWLMSRKHPAVISKGKTIDLSDLEADKLVMFQKTFYKPLYAIFAIAFPVAIPVHFWNETYFNSLFVSYFARYMIMLNATWLINSATHIFGTKPYDKSMKPVENRLVSFIALGEGWHNYHHAFPSDYRAAEYGLRYSLTTFIIDVLATFGLVYDLKEARKETVALKVVNKGDGSHPSFAKKKTLTQRKSVQKFLEDQFSGSIENDLKARHALIAQG